jgi:hypothetical protein
MQEFLMGEINMNFYEYLISLLFVLVCIAFVLGIRDIKCADNYV